MRLVVQTLRVTHPLAPQTRRGPHTRREAHAARCTRDTSDLASVPEGLNGEAVALETKTAQHEVRANASNFDTTASSIKLQKS